MAIFPTVVIRTCDPRIVRRSAPWISHSFLSPRFLPPIRRVTTFVLDVSCTRRSLTSLSSMVACSLLFSTRLYLASHPIVATRRQPPRRTSVPSSSSFPGFVPSTVAVPSGGGPSRSSSILLLPSSSRSIRTCVVHAPFHGGGGSCCDVVGCATTVGDEDATTTGRVCPTHVDSTTSMAQEEEEERKANVEGKRARAWDRTCWWWGKEEEEKDERSGCVERERARRWRCCRKRGREVAMVRPKRGGGRTKDNREESGECHEKSRSAKGCADAKATRWSNVSSKDGERCTNQVVEYQTRAPSQWPRMGNQR